MALIRKKIEELAEAQEFRFELCEYSSDYQSASIENIIFEILSVHANSADKQFIYSQSGAVQRISDFAPYFKNESFADEAEWRLGVREGGGERFRPSRGGGVIIPYLEFDLELPEKKQASPYVNNPHIPWNKSTIVECIVGPGNHQRLAKGAVEKFLVANGITAKCSISKVPWRQDH